MANNSILNTTILSFSFSGIYKFCHFHILTIRDSVIFISWHFSHFDTPWVWVCASYWNFSHFSDFPILANCNFEFLSFSYPCILFCHFPIPAFLSFSYSCILLCHFSILAFYSAIFLCLHFTLSFFYSCILFCHFRILAFYSVIFLSLHFILPFSYACILFCHFPVHAFYSVIFLCLHIFSAIMLCLRFGDYALLNHVILPGSIISCIRTMRTRRKLCTLMELPSGKTKLIHPRLVTYIDNKLFNLNKLI